MLAMFRNCVFSVMSGIMDVLVVVLRVIELIDNIRCLPDFSNINAFPWMFKDSIDFFFGIYQPMIKFYAVRIKALQSVLNCQLRSDERC